MSISPVLRFLAACKSSYIARAIFIPICTAGWIMIAAELVATITSGNIPRIVSMFGFLMIGSAIVVGPNCWGLIEARDGSNAQKVLMLMQSFGFCIVLSGMFARYMA